MIRCISLIFLFLLSITLIAQKKNNSLTQKESSRFVFSPRFFPINSLIINQRTTDDSKVSTKVNSRIWTGLRIERYSPTQVLDFGFDVNFVSQNYSFYLPQEFKVNETSLEITPFLSFKRKTKIEQIKHLFINLGLTGNITPFSNVTILDENIVRRYDEKDNFIRKFRLYGHFELGLKEDVFYNSTWNRNRRSGQTYLSLSLSFPFFNQSYIFDYKNPSFQFPFEFFAKNRTAPIALSLNYTQTFDWKKSFNNDVYKADFKTNEYEEWSRDSDPNKKKYRKNKYVVSSTEKWKNKPPLFHLLQSDSKSFASFYLKMILHPELDSIFINTESDIYRRTGSASYEFGFNYHFFNNITNFEDSSNKREKGIYRDIFLGAGLSNRIFLVESRNNIGRVNYLAFEVKGGGRVGLGRKGLYLDAGYKMLFNINKKYIVDDSELPLQNFSNLKNQIIFIGLGFRNSFYFHINYRPIDNLKVINNKLTDKLEFTVGYGI